MSGKSLVDQIKHYQKDIERCPDNSERMIRCIQRLYVLPIKVEHLQETGVGRSVNSLRKYKGDVGDAAKALVAKWKAMVAAEESGDEAPEATANKYQEVKASLPSSQPPSAASQLAAKTEQKIDRHSSKEKSVSKNYSSDNKKHHSESKSHSSDSKSHSSNSRSSSKQRDKSSEKTHSSSNKKPPSSSGKSTNHVSEKNYNSVKNHKSYHEKKHKSDSDESPPHKKHKKHHSNSRNHSSSSTKKKEPVKSASEDESSSSEESEESAPEDSQDSRSEREFDADSNNSNSGVESDSSSSSDHRHRSKHKSSRHRHSSSSSSHSKEKNHVKHKEHKDKSKEKEKYREHNHSKNHKHSDEKMNSSPNYKELIKENEKKIKKEKDDFVAPKQAPSVKNVKIERNEDGSIDSESGASFADALLGMDSYNGPKKKKKSSSGSNGSSSTSSSSNKKSSKSHSSHSSKHEKSEGSSSKHANISFSSRPKTINELVEPPELLSKKIKLEALDLDISSTLPEINPNYKPLPHIPETNRRPANKAMTEEAMFSLMTTKNQRTKVFSGNKVYQSTVPSLFSLCIQLLYDNIDAVEYTGGVPYNLLKPLLEKLNADQLYVLEHFNPYLIEDTDELWKFHCSKDFRSEKRQDLETWRELYLRCLEERERKLKALTANITQSMAKSTPVRQAKLAYVDAVVKPPRNIARKQAKYGTANSTSSGKNPAKQEILSKAVVGGNTPGVSAKDVVPTPPPVAKAAAHHPTPAILKKKKAPLMQKALQVMKGTRYKR